MSLNPLETSVMFPREPNVLETRPPCILYGTLPDVLSVHSAVKDGSEYTCEGGIRHTGGTCDVSSHKLEQTASKTSVAKEGYLCTISNSTTHPTNFQLEPIEIEKNTEIVCPIRTNFQLEPIETEKNTEIVCPIRTNFQLKPIETEKNTEILCPIRTNFQLERIEAVKKTEIVCPIGDNTSPSTSDDAPDTFLPSTSEETNNLIAASNSVGTKTKSFPSTSDGFCSSAVCSTSDGGQDESCITALDITTNGTSSEDSEESEETTPVPPSGTSRESRTYSATSTKSQESVKDTEKTKNVTDEKTASGDGLKKHKGTGVYYTQESTTWGATQSLRTTAKALRDLSHILKKTADESQPGKLISSTTATALSYVATALSDVTVSLSTLLSTSAINYDENNIVIVANAALIAETRAVSLSRYAGRIGSSDVDPKQNKKCVYDEDRLEDTKSDSDDKQLDESEQTDLDTVFDPVTSIKIDGVTSQSTITEEKSEKSEEESLEIDLSSTDHTISSKNVDSLGSNYTILSENGYTIRKTLGSGSFSTVKIADSEKHKCKVAVRIMTKAKVPQAYLDKFLPRVLKVVRVLRHANIIQFMQVIETTHRVYFVMEYAEHGTLLDRITRDSYILEPIAKKWFRQIAEAVKYLHEQGIVHRDIKCDNLLLDCYDDIKLSEFMFSRANVFPLNGIDYLCETYCGTPEYAAPEILRGIPYKPQLCDVWSIGIVLFAMVFGQLPFNEDSFKILLKKMEGKISYPKKPRVSTPCKTLISRILVNEKRRINISTVLCDRWFTCSVLPRSAIQQSRDILSTPNNAYTHGKRISSLFTPLRRLLRFNVADDCIREESASDSDQYWSASEDNFPGKRQGLPKLEACNLPFGLRLCLPSSKRLEQIFNQ